MSRPARDQAVVMYDLECGFCRWTVGRLLAWDRRHRLRPVAIQDPEGQRLLEAMDEHARLESWHLALPDGRLLSAGPALPEVIALLPGGGLPSRILRLLSPLTNVAYDLVARHRWLPGRLLSRRAVERATERVRARSESGSLVHADRRRDALGAADSSG